MADDGGQGAVRLAFDRAVTGEGQVVMLAGGRGAAAAEAVGGLGTQVGTIVTCRSGEGDQDISFGALDQLLEALGQPGAGLAHASRVSDPFDVGIRLLDALSAAAVQAPVVVAVDGVEWIDLPSLTALSFALRLLGGERVLAVLAGGDAAEDRLPNPLRQRIVGGTALAVEGPDRGAAESAGAAATDPVFVELRRRIAEAGGKADTPLANEAAELAEELLRRGAYPESASMLAAASALTLLPFAKQQRRLRGASIAMAGGDIRFADELIAGDEHLAESALGCLVQGRRAFVDLDYDTAETAYLSGWKQADQRLERTFARLIASGLADVQTARLRPAAGWARRAVDLFDEQALVRGNDPVSAFLIALAFEGRMREACDVEVNRPELFAELEPGLVIGQTGRGQARLWRDELEAARTDLTASIEALRRLGPDTSWMFAVVYLGDCEFRLGHWDEVLVLGEMLANAGEGLGSGDAIGLGRMLTSWVLAARGDFVEAGNGLAPRHDAVTPVYMASSSVGRARLADAQGNHAKVISRLLPLNEFGVTGLNNPAVLAWRDWLAASCIAEGELEEAQRQLDNLTRRAEAIQVRSLDATVARLQGLMAAANGDGDGAAALFTTAADIAAEVPMPFLRAVIGLDRGAFLVATGRGVEAKPVLEAALTGFVALGARPYAERVAAAMAEVGVDHAVQDVEPQRNVDAPVQAVAHLLRTGLNPEDIARRLLLTRRQVAERIAVLREHGLG